MKTILAFVFGMIIGVSSAYMVSASFAQEAEPKKEVPSTDPTIAEIKVPSFCGQTEQIFSLLEQTGFVGLFRGTYAQSASGNKIIFAYNKKDPSKSVIVQQNESAGISCIMMEIKDLEVNRKMLNAIAGTPT